MGNTIKNVLAFDEILSRIKKILKTESDKEVAIAIGMKPNAFYNRKKNRSVPLTEFVCIADTFNVSMNWLINGEGPIYKDKISDKQQEHSDEIPSSENITKVVIENQDMVKRFKNQERAKEINEDLIEIEEISDELLDSIASHIKSSLNAAKIVKEASKKTPKEGDSDLQGRSSA